ncbi:MAG: hypothetical protein RI910_2289, partial [Verrucomicrobiota bacterium]
MIDKDGEPDPLFQRELLAEGDFLTDSLRDEEPRTRGTDATRQGQQPRLADERVLREDLFDLDRRGEVQALTEATQT